MNLKILMLLIATAISLNCMSQSSVSHANKGWKYIKKKQYSQAKTQFELSLAKDTLPGNLSGMAIALKGLNELTEAKKYFSILLRKFPYHRFTRPQIELWNEAYPEHAISLAPYYKH